MVVFPLQWQLSMVRFLLHRDRNTFAFRFVLLLIKATIMKKKKSTSVHVVWFDRLFLYFIV